MTGRRIHGLSGGPTYRCWVNMRTRCENPKASKYHHYGARGVRVCERWGTFSLFLEDMGERPSLKHSLDRYPNGEGNYEPGNVRWATQSQQCRNKSTIRPVIRSDGLRFATITDAAEAVEGTVSGVWDVCNKKCRTHRGFGWAYA